MYARAIARRINEIRRETSINLRVVAKIRNSRLPPRPISKSEILQSDRADKGIKMSRVLERRGQRPTRRLSRRFGARVCRSPLPQQRQITPDKRLRLPRGELAKVLTRERNLA